MGAAGLVDETRSVECGSPRTWAGAKQPLRAQLEEAIGLPVIVENDANAAAWGEYHFGAGRNETHLVCVTVGTGIGGGVIFDGELFRGGFGIGAEFGHIQMVEDGRHVPLRPARLLGAVRQRQRPGARRPGARRAGPRGRPRRC